MLMNPLLLKTWGFEQMEEKLSTPLFPCDLPYLINISTSLEDEE